MEEAGIMRMKGPVEVHAVQSKDLSLWLLDSEVSAISFQTWVSHKQTSYSYSMARLPRVLEHQILGEKKTGQVHQ